MCLDESGPTKRQALGLHELVFDLAEGFFHGDLAAGAGDRLALGNPIGNLVLSREDGAVALSAKVTADF